MRAVIVDGVVRTDLLAKALVLDAHVALGALLFSAAVRHARRHGKLLQTGDDRRPGPLPRFRPTVQGDYLLCLVREAPGRPVRGIAPP